MIGKMVARTIEVSTLPARAVVSGSLRALDAANMIPGGLEQFQQDMLALLEEFDNHYAQQVENMTEKEREQATLDEIKSAENHLFHAMISMLRLVKLSIADESRIIQHASDDGQD